MSKKFEQLNQEIEKAEKSCGGRSRKKRALFIRQRRLPGRNGRTGFAPEPPPVGYPSERGHNYTPPKGIVLPPSRGLPPESGGLPAAFRLLPILTVEATLPLHWPTPAVSLFVVHILQKYYIDD